MNAEQRIFSCIRCVFYKQNDEIDAYNGHCRRYPPIGLNRVWPRVSHDDWCGEYRSR